MGRPPRYDTDSLLDAALLIAARQGPQALTMAAVIEAVGAPSGSLYHRFPSRPVLQAALWLRTLERFQVGFLEATAAAEDVASSLAVAAHTIEWSRAHREEARVLLYGAADFGFQNWPRSERDRLASRRAVVATAIADLAAKLDSPGDEGIERLTLAIVDIPLSLVRRHLLAGGQVPDGAERTIEPAVRALVRGARTSAQRL
jgi:AcrR family transcriptional regulator